MKTSSSKSKSIPAVYVALILVITPFIIGIASWRFSLKATPLSINQVDSLSSGITLSFSPSILNAKVNEESTLLLNINSGSLKTTYVEAEILYDENKLGTPVFVKNEFLQNIISGPTVASGKISFEFSSTPRGVPNSGTLATLKIKPKVVGSSTLSFTNTTSATALDAAGNYLPGNQLKTATDATVNVGGNNQTIGQVKTSTKPGIPVTTQSTNTKQSQPSSTTSVTPSNPNLLEQAYLG